MAAKRRTFRQRTKLSDGEARHAVERLLLDWFGDEFSIEERARSGTVDLLARVGSTRLVMEHLTTADAPSVDGAIQQLKHYVRTGDVPVVVVPFMGEVGRRLCNQASVSWLDLSGNADIRSPNLRILIDGRPNRYVHLGRPATPFAARRTSWPCRRIFKARARGCAGCSWPSRWSRHRARSSCPTWHRSRRCAFW